MSVSASFRITIYGQYPIAPKLCTRPRFGHNSPATICNKVVWPTPFSPTMPTSVPGCTENITPRKTLHRPNYFSIFYTCKTCPGMILISLYLAQGGSNDSPLYASKFHPKKEKNSMCICSAATPLLCKVRTIASRNGLGPQR